MIQKGAQEPRDLERHNQPPDGRPFSEQPRWRQDFPIAWPQDDYVSRRELTKFVVLTSGAFAVGQLWIVLKGFIRERPGALPAVPIARVDELAVGAGRIFQYPEGSTPRLLVRTAEDRFVAYDQQCTHLLCPVVPAVERGRLHCPCHNGWFDLESGRPVAGPPQRALTRVNVEVRGDTVWATGIEEPTT